ncbi:flagellar basal body-associated FliL family protein [Desulfitobacterium sp.]|uniref:flagellar basal body-associated FliL family protein n=1 Tax=Desulfitobacterium sp. TaxID=49981 RepID=UPI002BF3E15E|nr:flagellar basal body-associated FliL family protein [Desulfitobacterium sp.]HVJ49547.1 flagellar basal body-associated FliL family protein [Desulfitobacterium sp.]
MSRKSVVTVIITAILGVVIGVGGTIGVQSFLLPKPATTTQIVTQDGPVVEIAEFTVNLQGGSFLKTQIAVEGTDKKSDVEIKAKIDFIKDRINTMLSSKSLADMQPQNRDKLKKELIAQLNEVTGNKVQDVLFLTFIYQ